MLKAIVHKIEIFNSYCDTETSILRQLKETCFDVQVVLGKFFTYTVEFLRDSVTQWTFGKYLNHKGGYSSVLIYPESSEDPWLPLTRKYTADCHDIDESFDRIQKLAARLREGSRIDEIVRLESFLKLSANSVGEEAKLRCVLLPPLRSAKFFNREEIIEQIERHFARLGDDDDFRSLALWGLWWRRKDSCSFEICTCKACQGRA
jgi:hypothetical protein